MSAMGSLLLLTLAWLGVAACGSSTSGTPSSDSGGTATAGNNATGGSTSEGGSAAGVSGANAAAGVNAGGASSGASSGGASSGGSLAGGGSGNAGAGGGGSSGRGCPASAPAQGAPCGPAALGLLCFYDDCANAGARKEARCTTAIPEIGNPVQLWTVNTSACESFECGGQTCQAGQACVVLQGGARIGQCAPQSCGTGSLECGCVTGCYPGCTLQGFGPIATFTCNTCSDPRGCP